MSKVSEMKNKFSRASLSKKSNNKVYEFNDSPERRSWRKLIGLKKKRKHLPITEVNPTSASSSSPPEQCLVSNNCNKSFQNGWMSNVESTKVSLSPRNTLKNPPTVLKEIPLRADSAQVAHHETSDKSQAYEVRDRRPGSGRSDSSSTSCTLSVKEYILAFQSGSLNNAQTDSFDNISEIG